MSSFDLPNVWRDLDRRTVPLLSSVRVTDLGRATAAPFDYAIPEETTFHPWQRPSLPDAFGLGVIVGSSGSGKTLLLREFGPVETPVWAEVAPIVEHFASAEQASTMLYAAGLSSVPLWYLPHHALSTGQRFRADLARTLTASPALIDEFTSTIDRTVAEAVSVSLRRAVDHGQASDVVLATCHRDVLPWLRPDWIIDTDAGQFITEPKEWLHRSGMVAAVYRVDRTVWQHFVGHHYLNGDDLHPFARCYVATVCEQPGAFGAAIPFPHGYIRNAWRGTRTVTLPEYQGLGLGVRLSDWIAEAHVRGGYRYFSRTSHPRMGEYRDRHPNWRATASSGARQVVPEAGPSSIGRRFGIDARRVAYSHEWIA